jgi:hypothetical protein
MACGAFPPDDDIFGFDNIAASTPPHIAVEGGIQDYRDYLLCHFSQGGVPGYDYPDTKSRANTEKVCSYDIECELYAAVEAYATSALDSGRSACDVVKAVRTDFGMRLRSETARRLVRGTGEKGGVRKKTAKGGCEETGTSSQLGQSASQR